MCACRKFMPTVSVCECVWVVGYVIFMYTLCINEFVQQLLHHVPVTLIAGAHVMPPCYNFVLQEMSISCILMPLLYTCIRNVATEVPNFIVS